MSATFLLESSRYLKNSAAPISAAPFSVGFWAFPTATGSTQSIFQITNPISGGDYFAVYQQAAAWAIEAKQTTASTATAGTPTATWTFIVGRFISATNRRLSVLSSDGSVASAQNTVSKVPASVSVMALGAFVLNVASTFFSGNLGEFWYTNTDIQPDGAALQDSLLRQLAYGGPFSVPHIAKDIIEYRSLRKYPSSEADQIGEVFHGAAGRQTWSNVNGVTTGAHPPLPYRYVKPAQVQTELVI